LLHAGIGGAAEGGVRQITIELRGAPFHRQTFASVIYCVQRASDEISMLSGAGRDRLDEMGGTGIANAQLRRRVRIENDQHSAK
jgi:hypothetical protein